ncbi:tRNA (guanine-N(7)-)-methyltransferase [Bathycoccus prasinos]|jgi:tRNA (guanine-N7-)-methyltransferase|uniref:tRNA (guanine-N(7)-)-methyltransferase n=1 Tax=Bathycoccus prasinos TaxID=41875 RepID=K8EC95_9CHLO|nr:tRNA (guanine-N(7)-)-methyltransferase [Bathycoccus prasinos]CCO15566.1 tRNA (guanine-N(7)-)-methyltransferase [Bathycoccus prasinos]|eukprot:XP_007514129.1 tRNA (guanine-N(7)-)-methyltransferase [Bathycoccus prasinos]
MARIEEGDIKDKEKEVDLLGEIAVSANNQGKSIPRKRDYRQRAHCNPLSNGKWEDLPTAPDSFREDAHFESAFLDKLRMEKKGEKEAKITFADIGCGFGGLLVRLSPLFPKELIIGMEIRAQVSEYVRERALALRKEHPGEYQNISGLRTNSMKFLPNYFQRGQLKKLFFLFPDPHFKRSKRRRRIIQTALIAEYAFCLREGGILYTQTDVEDVGDWMKEKLDMHPLFRPMTEEELNSDVCVELLRRGTPTEEGQKVKRNSGSTWLHCYVRVHGNPRY